MAIYKPRTRPKSQLIIPQNWNGEDWAMVMMCVPDDPDWLAAVSGSVYSLTRGRTWDESTGVITDTQSIARDIWESLEMICSTEIANAIRYMADTLAASNNNSSGACCTPCGEEYDEGVQNQPDEFGPDERWPDEAAYLSDKCTAANNMYDGLLDVFQQLNYYSVDSLLSMGAAVAATAIGAMFTGLMSPIALGLGVITAIVGLLTGSAAINLGGIISRIQSQKSDIVCAMYTAGDTTTAESGIVSAIDDGSLTALEIGLLNLILYNNWLNQLFTLPQQVLDPVPAAPIDCASACGGNCAFYFVNDLEGWTYTDIGDAGYTATMTYDEDAEAMQFNHTMIGGGTSRLLAVSPVLECDGSGMQVVVNDSGSSDGVIFSWQITVRYLTAPDDVFSDAHTVAQTGTYVLTQNDTVVEIEILCGRTAGPSGTFTVDAFDVVIEPQP